MKLANDHRTVRDLLNVHGKQKCKSDAADEDSLDGSKPGDVSLCTVVQLQCCCVTGSLAKNEVLCTKLDVFRGDTTGEYAVCKESIRSSTSWIGWLLQKFKDSRAQRLTRISLVDSWCIDWRFEIRIKHD